MPRPTYFTERHAVLMEAALKEYAHHFDNPEQYRSFIEGGDYKNMQRFSKKNSAAIGVCTPILFKLLIQDFDNFTLPRFDSTCKMRIKLTVFDDTYTQTTKASTIKFAHIPEMTRTFFQGEASLKMEFDIMYRQDVHHKFAERIFKIQRTDSMEEFKFNKQSKIKEFNIGKLLMLANSPWVKSDSDVPLDAFDHMPTNALPHKNDEVNSISSAIDEYNNMLAFLLDMEIAANYTLRLILDKELQQRKNISVPFAPHIIDTTKSTTAAGVDVNMDQLTIKSEEGSSSDADAIDALLRLDERTMLIKFITNRLEQSAHIQLEDVILNLSVGAAVLNHFKKCYERLKEIATVAFCESISGMVLKLDNPLIWQQTMYEIVCKRYNKMQTDPVKHLREYSLRNPGINISFEVNFAHANQWKQLQTINHQSKKRVNVLLGSHSSIEVYADVMDCIAFLPSLIGGGDNTPMPSLRASVKSHITSPVIIAIGSVGGGDISNIQSFNVSQLFVCHDGLHARQLLEITCIPSNSVFNKWTNILSPHAAQFARALREVALDFSSVGIAMFDIQLMLNNAMRFKEGSLNKEQNLTDDLTFMIESGSSIFAYPCNGDIECAKRNVAISKKKIEENAEMCDKKRKELMNISAERAEIAEFELKAKRAKLELNRLETAGTTQFATGGAFRSLGADDGGPAPYCSLSADPAPATSATPATSGLSPKDASSSTCTKEDSTTKASTSMLQRILDHIEPNGNINHNNYSGCQIELDPNGMTWNAAQFSKTTGMLPPLESAWEPTKSPEGLQAKKDAIAECLVSAAEQIKKNSSDKMGFVDVSPDVNDTDKLVPCRMMILTSLAIHSAAYIIDTLIDGGADPIEETALIINESVNMLNEWEIHVKVHNSMDSEVHKFKIGPSTSSAFNILQLDASILQLKELLLNKISADPNEQKLSYMDIELNHDLTLSGLISLHKSKDTYIPGLTQLKLDLKIIKS